MKHCGQVNPDRLFLSFTADWCKNYFIKLENYGISGSGGED